MNKPKYFILLVFLFTVASQNIFAHDVIQQVTANGTRNLRPFTVNDNWEIQWDSKAGVHIGVHQPDGKLVEEGGSSMKPGQGSSYHPRGGTYFLEITSLDDWTITVVQLETLADSPARTPPNPLSAPSSDSIQMPSLAMSDFQWSRSKYGTLFVSFVLRNNSDSLIKDFTITCGMYGVSGTKIGSAAKTFYEIMPSNGIREYEGIEIGPLHNQARIIRCRPDR